MTATLTINSETVELSEDGHGLAGHIDIDGQRCRVFATVTPCGPKATTPAKWCAHRD